MRASNPPSPARSYNMARIGSKNTKPEIKVRSILHRMGFRFRLHNKKLPGSPDIILSKHKTVIFVHGCFWHRHQNCKRASIPKTNQEFWERKFLANEQRDAIAYKALQNLGWNVVVVWECEIMDTENLKQQLFEHISKSSKRTND